MTVNHQYVIILTYHTKTQMARKYLHRYKILSGHLTDLVSDGQQIGVQDYPEQFFTEKMSPDQIMSCQQAKHALGFWEGIWLDKVKQPIYRPLPVQGVRQPKTEITEEGVNYDDVYMDLCVPFDRYGNEISVGDTLMIASTNEVRRVQVIAIAKKPFMAGYGIVHRKLTVRDDLEDQTLTINNPRSTVKI